MLKKKIMAHKQFNGRQCQRAMKIGITLLTSQMKLYFIYYDAVI